MHVRARFLLISEEGGVKLRQHPLDSLVIFLVWVQRQAVVDQQLILLSTV